MRSALAIQAILLALTISPTTSAEEATSDALDLRLRLEKGQILQCTRTEKTTTLGWVGLAEQETSWSRTSTKTLEVLAVDEEGTATIKVTNDREAGSWRGPGGESEYDSDTMAFKNASWDILPDAVVVGRSFTVKVAPTGEVREAEGNELLRKAAAKAVATRIPEEQANEWVADYYTDQALRGLMVSRAFPAGLHPEEPVAIGDSWTVTTVCDAGFINTLLAKNTYTLISCRDGVATVRCGGVIEPDPDAECRNPNVKAAFNGTQESTFRIDEKTGMIIEAETKLDLEGEYLLRQTAEAEFESTMPGTIEMTVTLKIEQKERDTETE